MSGTQPPAPTPGAPAATPPGAPPTGQPPIGSSPATGASQNLGFAAKGIQAAGALLNGMAMVIPLVGAQTELGQALAKAMVDVGKHIPPGSSTPQGEDNFAKQMMARRQQMGPQMAAMAQQGAKPAMPATPTPGATPT